MIVSITVQLCSVCFSFIPKYLPTSQKPLSLTCDNRVAPDDIDNTTRALCGSLRPYSVIIGAIRLAAVIMATVAEPCVTLTAADIIQASIMGGSGEYTIDSAIFCPIPLSISTCLSTPPAPVIRIITPAGPNALVLRSSTFCLSMPLLRHRKYVAIRVAMISAEKGWPMNSTISVNVDCLISSLDTATVVNVLRRIRVSGMEIIMTIERNEG